MESGSLVDSKLYCLVLYCNNIHTSWKSVLNAVGTEVVNCDVKIEYNAQTFLSFAPPSTPTTWRYSWCSLEVRTLHEIGIHVKSTFYHIDMQRNCELSVSSSAF